MKRFLLLLIMLPTLLMGCAKNNSILNELAGDGAINFSPNSYTADVTQYEWANNDAVGVFMLPKNVSLANGGDADKRNKKYLYSVVSEELKADGTANQLNFNGIDWVKFVAYRPFVVDIENVATKNFVYPINVGVQTTDYKDIDFIYSNTGRLYSKIGGAIELEFRHMLSKLVLRFESAVPATLASLDKEEIYLKNMATTVNFDMKDETFKGWGNYAGSSIKAVSEITQVSDVGARIFEVIVTPTPVGGWSMSDRAIEYKTSEVKKKSLAASDEYESGMMYLYKIDLDEVKNEVEIEYVEVVEWGDGEAFGLDADITGFFRDPVFRQGVQDEFCGGRDKILKSDLVNVTNVSINSWLLPAPRTISTLAGIEYFPKLTTLNVEGVALKSLNVSRNLALMYLNCFNNQLTSLDVEINTALMYLGCSYNQLTSLDVSSNVALVNLLCIHNQLTSLDVSKNVNLTDLNCQQNALPSLDVSNNKALTYLDCSENQLTRLDVSKNVNLPNLICFQNALTRLDISNNTALTQLRCDRNQLTSLDVSNNTALTYLLCFSNLLTSLDVSKNTALTTLECNYNSLTHLDVSTNTALMYLNCHGNQLTSLDVEINTALTYLGCSYNQLPSLDMSRNVALTQLICSNSQLTSLDVSKNTKLMTLECEYNSLGSLDVSNNTALTLLYCNYIQLTSLDVSTNTALMQLRCDYNQLTSLDVSTNTALWSLYCNYNQLTSLDVSTNTALMQLRCDSNQLTSLDLSALDITKLWIIQFNGNPGNGTTAGVPNLADFEVKLPRGTDLGNMPHVFPTPTSGNQWFQWPYQFSGGVMYSVKTKYTVAPAP